MIFTSEILQTLFENSLFYQPSYIHFLRFGQLAFVNSLQLPIALLLGSFPAFVDTVCNSIGGEKPGNKAKVA